MAAGRSDPAPTQPPLKFADLNAAGDRRVHRGAWVLDDAAVADREAGRVRALLLEEAGGRCAVCGYDRCSFNLHFHHVDPASKAFKLAMGTGKSLATYRAEARKCVLVCANCHGEIECGQIPSPPPRSRWPGAAAGHT